STAAWIETSSGSLKPIDCSSFRPMSLIDWAGDSDWPPPPPQPGPWGYAPDPISKKEKSKIRFLAIFSFPVLLDCLKGNRDKGQIPNSQTVKKKAIIFPVILTGKAFPVTTQTADSSTPNTESFTVKRRYLTECEVEQLMDTARKVSRRGHRDATMILVA